MHNFFLDETAALANVTNMLVCEVIILKVNILGLFHFVRAFYFCDQKIELENIQLI